MRHCEICGEDFGYLVDADLPEIEAHAQDHADGVLVWKGNDFDGRWVRESIEMRIAA